MRGRFYVSMVAAVAAGGLFVLNACSDDVVAPASVPDASVPDAPRDEPTTDAGAEDAKAPVEDADAAVEKEVTFTVPPGGGTVDFAAGSMKVAFSFPASAGGKTITLAPAKAEDIGWPAGQFSEAIKLGPDGERFADPILVKPDNPELVSMLVSFGDGPEKGPASAVPLSADGSAFELHHFSTLVFLPPGRVCDSESHTDTADAPYCAAASGGRTTMREIGCKGYSYCLHVTLKCCVAPGETRAGCTWADAPVLSTQTPTGSNGGLYPYCEGDPGDWDGGASGCLMPGPLYSFRGGDHCEARRAECGSDFGGSYSLTCNATECRCTKIAQGGAMPEQSAPFPKGATCDHVANMKAAFVQKCNFPAHQ